MSSLTDVQPVLATVQKRKLGHRKRPRATQSQWRELARRGSPNTRRSLAHSRRTKVRLKLLPSVFPIPIQFVRPRCKTPVRNTGLLQKLCMQWQGCGLWPLTLSVGNDKCRRKKISRLYFPFLHSARKKKVVIIWLLPFQAGHKQCFILGWAPTQIKSSQNIVIALWWLASVHVNLNDINRHETAVVVSGMFRLHFKRKMKKCCPSLSGSQS